MRGFINQNIFWGTPFLAFGHRQTFSQDFTLSFKNEHPGLPWSVATETQQVQMSTV